MSVVAGLEDARERVCVRVLVGCRCGLARTIVLNFALNEPAHAIAAGQRTAWPPAHRLGQREKNNHTLMFTLELPETAIGPGSNEK